MIFHATSDFWTCFDRLQTKAKSAYAVWSNNPGHPGMHFKPVASAGEGVWSVRIGIQWRALGVRDGEVMIWFWIGSHADYDRLIGG